MTEAESREALVHLSREAIARELSNATAGNISVRAEQGMLITPSSIPPDRMTPAQCVPTGFDGAWEGSFRPSSEWALHARIYQTRPEVGAIVHAHPPHCVALSALRRPIPAFHYMVAGFGGDEVPCCAYATFGTKALADAVAQTVGTRFHACLMANHGAIAFGPDLETAFGRLEKLEALARQYLLACSANAPIVLLTEAEMRDVRAAYAAGAYGVTPAAAKG
ncbi:class II aldolase/adducin family protein [Albimonas pacifica]|uniref:L-fuculose-phosphate aldolase n=1 Tax=Albimonas pacifica TaxID=1114924 RepID=A0A1I3BQT1_9RHOB|nr:class II aldolase/adducin family protein [Albimonas pacifica]SFH64668.1 L-fuculose-phosphate aldolase [Albimonas pacifica]